MQRVVCSTVLVVKPKPLAHFNAKAWRHYDVPTIKQPMKIGPEQDTIPDRVIRNVWYSRVLTWGCEGLVPLVHGHGVQ